MKKDYKHPRFKAVELKMKGNLLELSATTGYSGSGNGDTSTGRSGGPGKGEDDLEASAKGFSWSFDDDY